MEEHQQPHMRPHLPTPEQYLAGLEDRQNEPSPFGPQRPKRKWLRKIVILVALIGVLFGLNLLINLLRLSSNPFDLGRLKGEREGRINVLLLGVGDSGHAAANLSDTLMVASIDPSNNQMVLLSIPRDLRVNTPGYGRQKINQAHSSGGPDLTRKVVENILDIPIHYYARANFSGLRQAVDAVGGVDIDVKETLYDPEYPCDKNQYRSCGLTIKKGQQHMDGATALKYARCRKGNCGDDFGRALRQQEILQAVRQKAVSLGNLINPVRMSQMSAALGDNIKTDLSVNQMLRLGKMVQEVSRDRTYNVVFSTAEGGFLTSSNTSSDLLPASGNFEDMQEFVQNIFKLAPVWVENSNIVIQNGTAIPGIGIRLKDKIQADGYRINVVGLINAIQKNYEVSQIIDYSGGSKPHTRGYLEEQVGVKASLPDKPVKNPPANFVIILGSDYAVRGDAKASDE